MPTVQLSRRLAGVIWGRTMGTAVLSAESTNSSSGGLRSYAHCSKRDADSVTLVLSNLGARALSLARALSRSPSLSYTHTHAHTPSDLIDKTDWPNATLAIEGAEVTPPYSPYEWDARIESDISIRIFHIYYTGSR